jgi:hypothetical protein
MKWEPPRREQRLTKGRNTRADGTGCAIMSDKELRDGSVLRAMGPLPNGDKAAKWSGPSGWANGP